MASGSSPKHHSGLRYTETCSTLSVAWLSAPCLGGEFQCSNSHCIAEHLYCNDYDNCGDGSDVCLLSSAGIAGVVIAAVIVVIIIAVIVAVVLYRRQQHRRLEKVSG